MRYLDLFMYFISLYNTLMKIFFIASTAFVIYLMRYKKPYCSVINFVLVRIIQQYYRPIMDLRMTSPTGKYCSQLPLSLL
jgi:hypothetical protein